MRLGSTAERTAPQITDIKYSSLISMPFKVRRQQLARLNYSKHANCIVAKRAARENDYAHTFPFVLGVFPAFSRRLAHFLISTFFCFDAPKVGRKVMAECE